MAAGATLSTQDMRTALALAGELATCRGTDELEAQFESVPRLIPADSVVISALHTASGRLVVEAGDSDVYRPEMLDAVSRHWREHPVMAGDLARVGHGARRLSDFTTRDWWQHGLFDEFYRPLGMPRELSVQLSWEGTGSSCCLVLHRSGRDFTEREVLLLEQVSPHLQAAWARVARETLLASRLRLVERALDDGRQVMLIVGRGGHLAAVDGDGQAMLAHWFGQPPRRTLPIELADWWASARIEPVPSPLDFSVGGQRLRARLLPGIDEDLVTIAAQGDARSMESRLARLLPITHREAEVLARLADGRTNDGIAYDLGISRHTVVRHIERIYTKLGTHTRAAATRAALDALYGDTSPPQTRADR